MNLLCVLDFYVHESAQRNGHGYQLFEYMLQVSIYHFNLLENERVYVEGTDRSSMLGL